MPRDDLFTHIHKALRKGLFDVTVRAGATDWDDPVDVAALRAQWRPLRTLLDGHTAHEDTHVFRVLDGHDTTVLDAVEADHERLDAALAALDVAMERAVTVPDPVTGLEAYRRLALFVAAYLPHIHAEETTVMASIWAQCTDEEIAVARAGLMAEISPQDRALSLELMLGAVDPATRRALEGAVAAAAG